VSFAQHGPWEHRHKAASGHLDVASGDSPRIFRFEGTGRASAFFEKGVGSQMTGSSWQKPEPDKLFYWRSTMTIKSLLLGSAAALVAVSGARAADAVMAEPEAVEYVRVCDAYGAGYFYIPGTETCLKIAGRVRYQINFSDNDNGWKKQAQAMLNFTAKSDTELGTLTSYIEMEANSLSGNIGGSVDTFDATGKLVDSKEDGVFGLGHAWIQLGGLKMGRSDTLFDGSINGEFDSYGGNAIHFLGYTFSSGNGFTFTLNLEEENFDVDYLPNVVAKASYTQGGYTLDAWAAYDDGDFAAEGDEFALKAILTAKVSDPFTLQIGATYNSGVNFYDNDYTWSVGASGKYQVNEKLAVTLGAQYLGDFLDADPIPALPLVQTVFKQGKSDWKAGIVVNYVIVPQFTTELAVNYDAGVGTDDDSVSGYLRFQREF
jgi:opacity protein-like surface antigen